MLTSLGAPDRTVIWVGPPPFKNEHDNVAIQQISDLSRSVIAMHPDAIFVDDYSMFLDANGKYTDRLPDANGNLVNVRSGDGVHFTTDGGNQLAHAVFGVHRRAVQGDRAGGGRRDQADDPNRGQHARRARQQQPPGRHRRDHATRDVTAEHHAAGDDASEHHAAGDDADLSARDDRATEPTTAHHAAAVFLTSGAGARRRR